MADSPSAPPSGPGGPGIGGSIDIEMITLFIKDHYFEIFAIALLVYIGYYAVIVGSKYIFKPAYLVDPYRGTKRYIGRVIYYKIMMGDNKYEELRGFIKDGWTRPIVPHLFADMDRINILSNGILLDFRSVVYDHDRKMFVGSLTGVKDTDMDGLAVEQRIKEKFAMIDVSVSMAVRGSPMLSQHNMINNAIPLPDGFYEEDIRKVGAGRYKGLLPKGMRGGPIDADDLDHVDRVIYEKEAKREKVKIVKKRRPMKKHRFLVGESETYNDEEETNEPDDMIDTIESPSSLISSMDNMPIKNKILGSSIDDVGIIEEES